MKQFTSDIDIDFGDRDSILKHIEHTPATIYANGQVRRHNSGVYVTTIPYDPTKNLAALDYETAESRGYMKIDFLNVGLYKYVRDEAHLAELMKEPDWSMLEHQEIFQELIHIGAHWDTLKKMPEPVNSIPRMAMFLAVIRPGKRHLIGKTWQEVAETIWEKTDDAYTFKKSHSLAYAHLVVVHMNLLLEGVIELA